MTESCHIGRAFVVTTGVRRRISASNRDRSVRACALITGARNVNTAGRGIADLLEVLAEPPDGTVRHTRAGQGDDGMNALVLGFALTTCTSADPEPPKPPSPERIKELVKKLEEPTREVSDPRDGPPDGPWPTFNYRWHGREINELKRAGDAAVPPLLALLDDKTKPGQARAQAAAVLAARLTGNKVRPDPNILAAMNTALKDNEPALRWGGLNQLARYGLAGNREIREWVKGDPVLVESVNKCPPLEDVSFSVEVMDALLPRMIAALDDKHPEVAIAAAAALDRFGRPKSGTTELIAALKREEPEVRAAAAWTLSRIGRGDPAAVKAVLECLDPKEPIDVYAQMIGAVGRFGPNAKAAVPLLIEALKDGRKGVQVARLQGAAVVALGQIGPDAKAAIPALIAYIPKACSTGYREEILVSLERIDPPTGKRAREEQERKDEEYRKWVESRSQPTPPSIVPPPIFPNP